jgi:starch synthase
MTLRVAHVASEMAPFAKVGGLGDVVLGLCRELQQQGHQPMVLLPLYGCLDRSVLAPLKPCHQDDEITVWSSSYEGLPLYFVDPRQDHFRRPTIYGWPDDVERFAHFTQGAWSWLSQQPIDLIHCHDWQTACMAHLAKDRCPTLLTLHNIDYQGACAPEQLEPLGLEEEDNCLRVGIRNAGHVTAVSPTYTREIQTPLGGRGLDQLLLARGPALSPVLNGIDTVYWNPTTDPLLPVRYDGDCAAFKKGNRAQLCQQLSLRLDLKRPLVGMVARLVPQKGIDLLPRTFERVLELGGQMILLGTSPIPQVQQQFEALQEQYQECPDIHLHLEHDEPTAHRIFAASDLFLVPSLFEPCGLTQLISLHYGALPLVRRTGGLADTVFDLEQESDGNGFVFEEPTSEALLTALERAFNRYQQTPEDWGRWVQQAMAQDVGWTRSAATYAALYKSLLI